MALIDGSTCWQLSRRKGGEMISYRKTVSNEELINGAALHDDFYTLAVKLAGGLQATVEIPVLIMNEMLKHLDRAASVTTRN